MDSIIKSIKSAYGSLERPNWSFVAKRMKGGLYDNLVKDLASLGAVQEATDLNDDCSRCIGVILNGQAITLRLSLVGKIACVYNESVRFYSGEQLLNSRFGRELSMLLKAKGIEILDYDELRSKIVFGEGLCTLYEVLFSSDDLLSLGRGQG